MDWRLKLGRSLSYGLALEIRTKLWFLFAVRFLAKNEVFGEILQIRVKPKEMGLKFDIMPGLEKICGNE